MTNVAFIITKSEIGGAQTWVNEIAKLIEQDCKVFLITSEYGWLTQCSVFSEVYIIPGIKKYFDVIAYIKLIKFIKKNNIKSIVASSANAGVYSRLARLTCSFKCIYVSHGWSCLYNGGRLKSIFCKIEKYLSKLTDVIWCISESDREKAIKKIGIDEGKIITATNAVPPMPARLKECLEYKILFVGRLTHPKRPCLLAQVISKKPQYKLDIVGGGEQLESLKAQFKDFKNIRFLGEIKGFSAYKDYDIFALISDSEGLPMSGIEAHTAGVPLLLSDVGGCHELIEK
ncbi:glycosyltransferase family 4 protein, partial [Salmonella enterica]|nr:glycosyltransferase family 4 protein [Salmonella enterica]